MEKKLSKQYEQAQELAVPWMSYFQPFIDYFWQAGQLGATRKAIELTGV